MGTRFLFTKKKTLGFVVQLKHKGVWLANADATRITKMVVRAKAMLSTTMAMISTGSIDSTTKGFANTYFLTGPGGPTQMEWNGIANVLQLTYQGLGNDVTLKLGADGNHGYVSASVVSPGTAGAVIDQDGDHVSYNGHTLHVSKKRMLRNPEVGTITIIHEASHKYANTFDHDDQGYREEDDSGWWAPGLTRAQALKNADSFAYFAYRVGESRGL